MLAILVVSTVWIFVPAFRFAPICAPAEAWLIDHGFIKVEDADWGYLRLRSGACGLTALRDLERHGSTDQIKMSAARVILVRTESAFAGAQFYAPSDGRIDLAALPKVFDGHSLKIEVFPDGILPRGFADDTRFDLAVCSPFSKTSHCRFTKIDLNGDGRIEMVLSAWRSLMIFEDSPQGWSFTRGAHVCAENSSDLEAGRYHIVKSPYDNLTINGHVVDLLATQCADYIVGPIEATITSDDAKSYAMEEIKSLRRLSAQFNQIKVLSPIRATLPKSFISDVRYDALIPDVVSNGLTSMSERYNGTSHIEPILPQYGAPPDCLVADDVSQCYAVLQDLNRDGSPELIFIDRKMREESSDFHKLSLFRFDGHHWHLLGNGQLCAEWGPIETLKFATATPEWPSIFINGGYYPIRPYNSGCMLRRMQDVLY